jgi:lysine biosynthesis protein LysW
MATCPECDAQIEIDDDDLEDMEIGDPWDCDACGSHLRVVTVEPLEFDPDDDDDDEEDDDVASDGDELGDLDDGDDDDDDDDDGDWDE